MQGHIRTKNARLLRQCLVITISEIVCFVACLARQCMKFRCLSEIEKSINQGTVVQFFQAVYCDLA